MVKPLVAVIMGSNSDLPVMQKAIKVLKEFEIPHEIRILSAHRTPDQTINYVKEAYNNGVKIIIAGAGKAAHLPGIVAAYFPFPVIGVPMKTSDLGGVDSLYSIVQMPTGIPVATVAINGAANASLLAIEILAVENKSIYLKLLDFRKKLKSSVIKKNKNLK